MVSLATFRRLCKDVHPRWLSRLVTLVVCLYWFRTKRADLRCTFSIFLICPSLYGSQTVHAYSSVGRTIALYAISLSLMLLTFRFLRRKPSVLLALVVMWTWKSQSRSCAIVTPRYFAEVTLARVWLCNWYDGLSSFFVLMGLMTGRVVHFPGWKDMSQFFSHVSSCWRSFCICVWSWPVVIARSYP